MHDRIRSIVRGQRGGTVRGVAGLLAAAAAAALVLALVVGGASAPSADARSRAGTCNPFGLEQALQIYPIADGSYGFSVYGVPHKVTLSNVTNTTFDWSSSVGMDAVVVKSWFNGDVYTYDEAYADTGLKTSKNKKAVFCLDTNDNETPPPTATDTPTPTDTPVPPTATDTPVPPTATATPADEPQEPTPVKCTNRKGCSTPEEETGKCIDRQGCPTPKE